MDDTVKILVVDDEPLVAERIKSRLKFLAKERFGMRTMVETVTGPGTAQEARAIATDEAREGGMGHDLVVLDVSLGVLSPTGLDLLLDFKHNNSAWMVALLTGIEGDRSADAVFGAEKAAEIRRQLRKKAMQNFHSDRVTVIEKSADPDAFDQRLEQLLVLYEHVSAQRNIFRPLDIGTTVPPQRFWQIRYDCGDLVTVPDKAGFTTLWMLLKGETVTPEKVQVHDPATKRRKKKKHGARKATAPDERETSAKTYEEAVTSYAERHGHDVSDPDIMAEVRLQIRQKIQAAAVLFGYMGDTGRLFPADKARFETLSIELGPALLEAAEVLTRREQQRDAASLGSAIDSAPFREVAWTGSVRVEGAHRETSAAQKNRAKIQGEVRNRQRNYFKLFRDLGMEEFARHLDYTVQPKRNVGWQYVGKLQWSTSSGA